MAEDRTRLTSKAGLAIGASALLAVGGEVGAAITRATRHIAVVVRSTRFRSSR